MSIRDARRRRKLASVAEDIYARTTPRASYAVSAVFRVPLARYHGDPAAARADVAPLIERALPGAEVSPGIVTRYHGRKVLKIAVRAEAGRAGLLAMAALGMSHGVGA